MESIRSFPIPGHANTVSVTTANAITPPSSRPSTVTTGIMMFFMTCTSTTREEAQPLGPGKFDVVLKSYLTGAGPREADDQGHLEQRQIQCRQ